MNAELQAQKKQQYIIPAGDYTAEAEDVQLVDNPFAQGQQDTKQIRIFAALYDQGGQRVLDDQDNPVTAWLHMGRVLGFKKDGTPYKPLAWSENILGRKINRSEYDTFNFGELQGKRFRLTVDDLRDDGQTPGNSYKVRPLGKVADAPAVNQNGQATDETLQRDWNMDLKVVQNWEQDPWGAEQVKAFKADTLGDPDKAGVPFGKLAYEDRVRLRDALREVVSAGVEF